ncbi:MAG: ATP-dependent metallopeptidase FtsH/Yme1/Tma family protein [Candidatus Melainabacteria bacterium]|nr:ATP-dependent metallopeptidase FtsH/Yme1/Tma family protein [Candidatus Melainabacteria bacterium]MBI3307929.1 ATP-dependent metallopeptidase FtsH/Yme1/Tma family protein [Candidatus Melainabacteria bacterium]
MSDKDKKMKKFTATIPFVVLFMLLSLFVITIVSKKGQEEVLTYSEFTRIAMPDEGTSPIKKVILTNESDSAIVVFSDDTEKTVRVPNADGKALKALADTLISKYIEVEVRPPSGSGFWLSFLTSILVPALFLIMLIFMIRSAQSGGAQAMTFGRSRAKMQHDQKVKITFADVAGIDEAKQELEEVVDFLKSSEKYQAIGARIPKGVLLVGAPGTGKTLLAKAVAGEAGVPFFSISGSDFVEMFVGVGASRVRDLFDQAKKNAPCIVFVDELDAVGRQRGAGLGGGHDEREQTLNQLLVEMDGFEPTTGIIVLAATNRPDILDSALLRPGRFDRQVVIDRPDVAGREAILKVHAKGKPLKHDVDLKTLAKRTPGFTGADLSNMLNEAALLAARRNKKEVSMGEMEEAIDKVLAGPEKKSKILTAKDKEITAYHEIGHALMAYFEKNADPLHKVTIIPRGMALGITMTLPEEDHVNYSKAQLYARIKVLLGGRIAEEIVFNDVTTGAQNDLQKATELLRKMITQFGMSENLGPLTFGQSNEHVFLGRDFGHVRDYSEDIATKIDSEMKNIISRLYDDCKRLIVEKRKHLDALAQVLLEKETIDKDEFREIVEQVDKGTFVAFRKQQKKEKEELISQSQSNPTDNNKSTGQHSA